MDAASGFLQRFEEFIGASGWRTMPSPSQLVEQWREFVEICGDGYASTIYEFENERSIRDLLERVLHDPILRKFPETETLRQQVTAIDHHFQLQCREDVKIGGTDAPWWQRCVPQHADGEFAEDLESQFGIKQPGA